LKQARIISPLKCCQDGSRDITLIRSASRFSFERCRRLFRRRQEKKIWKNKIDLSTAIPASSLIIGTIEEHYRPPERTLIVLGSYPYILGEGEMQSMGGRASPVTRIDAELEISAINPDDQSLPEQYIVSFLSIECTKSEMTNQFLLNQSRLSAEVGCRRYYCILSTGGGSIRHSLPGLSNCRFGKLRSLIIWRQCRTDND
jgi:hypothetical protein